MTSQNQSFTLQSGVLAFYKSKICLVSTPKLRKWVIPKGNIPANMGPADSALKECYEEAGLIGYLRPAPLGSYEFYKTAEIASLVLVYELIVTQVLDSWPESWVMSVRKMCHNAAYQQTAVSRHWLLFSKRVIDAVRAIELLCKGV